MSEYLCWKKNYFFEEINMNQQRINAAELNSNFQCNGQFSFFIFLYLFSLHSCLFFLSILSDLKAFERRLMETISYQRPKEVLWRTVLIGNLFITMTTSYWWLADSTNNDVTFFESLQEHYFFSLSCLALILMLLFGIHKRVIQSAM